mmetsp:Transcript_6000/g.7837  ORF Transcript_6000/g.7837 Transcript_6000/m.7837 type:complete len:397 (-) Transcript_6000:55-1245(-)
MNSIWRGLGALSPGAVTRVGRGANFQRFSSISALNSDQCGFEQLVGNTRLVYLKRASDLTGCNIFGKCEYENPGGSIKDRAALWMLRDAESKGFLKRGEPGIIVEGTAGNTGIGLALAAGMMGYECVICIANTQSEEKLNVLRWAGAHLVTVPAVPYKNPNNYVHVAKRLAEKLNEMGTCRSFYANQWDNLANRQAHIDGTGPEIVKQVSDLTGGGTVDAFSCAMGTGGTLSGVAEYLRSVNKDVQIGLTDPYGAVLTNYFESGEMKAEGSSISEGVGQGRITGNIEGFKPDFAIEISDEDMMKALTDTQKHEGLALGTSAGINIAGAIAVANKVGPGKNVVTVLCDLGQRYAGKLYNPKFLRSKGLPVAEWLEPSRDSELNKAVSEAAKLAIESI